MVCGRTGVDGHTRRAADPPVSLLHSGETHMNSREAVLLHKRGHFITRVIICLGEKVKLLTTQHFLGVIKCVT